MSSKNSVNNSYNSYNSVNNYITYTSFSRITEEHFWRNYFYRVSLIIQAGDLGTLGTDDAFGKRDADDDGNF